MNTQGTMKQLLNQHNGNPAYRKQSSILFDASGAAEAASRKHGGGGFPYLTELRTGDMKSDHPLLELQRKAEAKGEAALLKFKKRAHAAFHEAAHCVIACDLDHIVTRVVISASRGSYMTDAPRSVYADRNHGEGHIALAGVALEHILHTGQDILCIKPYGGSDLKTARLIYLDSCWMQPEYRLVKERLLELWPVVEYAAVLILRRTAKSCTHYPNTRWNNTLWKCIWGEAHRSKHQAVPAQDPPKFQAAYRSVARKYLKDRAPWASRNPPIEFLSTLILH